MTTVKVLDKEFALSIPEKVILEAIKQTANQINAIESGKDVIFLAILNGSFMFASDLLKCITFPAQISFTKLASYQGTQSTERVTELLGISEDLTGKTVLVVEDIVDTGHTLEKIHQILSEKNVAEIKVVTCLYKPAAFKGSIPPDYVCIEIPNDFIVGYGLDYDGFGRNLRDIYSLVK
ncbi:MAG TPA: hypoxanthine phosphoribosyltransferase [Bacteroidales bacterium]|nr:hypoxanthine phosphoribosyltransferase [Bacteroidales bacterium]